MGLLSRLNPFRAKAAEGEYREGPYQLPVSNGWLPAGSPWNFWQLGRNVQPYGQTSAMVEACVGAYSQTVAMCPGDHWRRLNNGGRERIAPANSALARMLRKPNDYQSISDFLLNLTRSLYFNGNAYALALRNDRGEIAEMHLMRPKHCAARVAADGSVFYDLGGNEIIDARFGAGIIVPARDVLHVRLHTPRHPLKGETPLMAAALDVAAGNVMLERQIAFFSNQSKPSFILSTDEKLTPEQAADLRKRWNEQTTGLNAGGTPILSWGIKPTMIANTAQDAQLAETMKMTEQNVALTFRVPMQILGLGDTTYASTELLMQSWIASGLGFTLNHIEEAFGQLFRLKGYPEEYLELSTDSLLRSAMKDRIDALARGVQGGLYSPDEARAREDLPSVPGGHGQEPRVQQQVVPLSWHEQQAEQVLQLPPPPEDNEADEDEQRHDPEAILERIYAHRLH